MRLQSNGPLFADIPVKNASGYESPFPSSNATVEGKYQALLTVASGANALDAEDRLVPTLGQVLLAQQGGIAWNSGQALVNGIKCWQQGDVLSDWLPHVAWIDDAGPYAGGVRGLFAGVTFPQSANPADISLAIAKVALNVALLAFQAVPLVGQIVGAIVKVAEFLVRLFTLPTPAERQLMVPWTKGNSDLSEALVRDIVLSAAGTARWTSLWMPPYEVRAWSLTAAMDEDGEEITGGQVWAPLLNGQIAYSQGLGAIPNSLKCAAHVQRIKSVFADVVDLIRRFYDPYHKIAWGSIVTDVGSYFPDAAQICGGMWQQVMRPGNPDMYKVHASALGSAWADYFGQFFDSAWTLYKKDPSIGEMVAPYIATVLRHDKGDDVRLGIPNMRRPHPAPFVTPDIFTKGPGTPDTRTSCLWIEEDTPKRTDAWPFDALVGSHKPRYPKQHPLYDYRPDVYVDKNGDAAFDQTMWSAVKRGGGGFDGKAPPGYRCIAWPTGAELLTGYARPDVAITSPACKRLRELQELCLTRTLVCAYVRPYEVKGLEAHEAFLDKQLRAACVDARTLLLALEGKDGAPPPRWGVNLKDVDDLDPEFAAELRARGVTNSQAQRQAVFNHMQLGGLKAGAGGIQGGDDLPPAIPPAEGVAFDDVVGGVGDDDSGGGMWAAIAGALAVAGGAAAAVFSQPKRRTARHARNVRR